MLNECVLMGRLTRDPEMRRTGSGIPVTTFTIAVDRDYVEKGQEKITDFIDIVTWRSTAEFAAKYFTKGRMAVVCGRLQIRNWTDQNGTKRRNAEIVAEHVYFGDSKKEESAVATPQSAAPTAEVNCRNAAREAPLEGPLAQGSRYGVPVYPGAEYPVMDDEDQLPLPWETGGMR